MEGTTCQTCGFEMNIKTQNIETGELISCHDCGQEYEVTKITPVTLKEAPTIEEDYGQ